MTHRRPDFHHRPASPRLIFFADGIRIPKRTAVRLVMLHLVLSHSDEWSYAAAERELEQVVNSHGNRARKMEEINGIQTASGLVWVQPQWPKPRKSR